MNTSARRAASLVGTFAAATSLVALSPAVSPAQSTTLAHSYVTVTSDDYTPAVGQTFHLSGAVWSGGHRVPAVIRVKTYNHGEWVQLRGAAMHTNRDNQYTMRIILFLRGQQLLRVIGNPDDPAIETARKTITVTVH